MRILICDDDIAFAQRLAERMLPQLQSVDRWGKIICESDPAALTDDELRRYDLAFLDVDMGEITGLALARRFRALHLDTLLIFVTNYLEYSCEGYEVQAFRYLLKAELDEKLEPAFTGALQVLRRTPQHLRINCMGEKFDLQPKQITYIETITTQRKLRLHLSGASRAEAYTRVTMNEMEELLAGLGFLRTHKSYLVNMSHIKKLQSTAVYLDDDIKLPISSHNYPQIRVAYLQWKGAQRWNIG